MDGENHEVLGRRFTWQTWLLSLKYTSLTLYCHSNVAIVCCHHDSLMYDEAIYDNSIKKAFT